MSITFLVLKSVFQSSEIRERLLALLGCIAKQNGIKPACIGGVADHVHLLLSLPTTVAIAKAVQLIKVGSSLGYTIAFGNCESSVGKKDMARSA
jgi:REP element-mobilizing transposase RayT